MKYYSTHNHNLRKGLEEAVLDGLAPDGGLYMPTRLNPLPAHLLREMKSWSLPDISVYVAGHLFGADIPAGKLEDLTREAVSFPTPLVDLHDNLQTLELFHGPTLAFKDVGARFMARMLGHFTGHHNKAIQVLVATSGDTGSAVAHGFYGVEGVQVYILYPSGKVSRLQEKQFTTLGKNIAALEIQGNFDDCQALVKQAFVDPDLRKELVLTSANSINLARLLPQSFYYFYAASRHEPGSELVISVPSGNFGNLTAGLIAWELGLPVSHFIAATNINDVVPEYLDTGRFKPRPSKQTIANAMDVGNPSNFARILDLYKHDLSNIRSHITGYSYTDDQIRESILELHRKTGYLADPHGATAYRSLLDHPLKPGQNAIFLETAHPAKFPEVIEKLTGKKMELPPALAQQMNHEKKVRLIKPDFSEFKEYLLS